MTGGVDLALQRIAMPKPGADREPHGKREPDTAFHQALAKDNAPSRGVAGKANDAAGQAEDAPKWIRFGSKLGSTISGMPVVGSKAASSDRATGPDQDNAEVSDSTGGALSTDDPEIALKGDGTDADSLPITAVDGPHSGVQRPDPKVGVGSSEGIENDVMAPTVGQDAGSTASGLEQRAAAASVIRPEPDRLAPRSASPNRQRADQPNATDSDHQLIDKRAGHDRAPVEVLLANPSIGPKSGSEDGLTSLQRPDATGRSGVEAVVLDKNSVHKSVQSDQAGDGARPIVVAEQSFPAPLRSTSLALAASLAETGSLKFDPRTTQIDSIRTPSTIAPAHSLSLQLHPAELGMVTAKLKLAGEQLTIELQAENSDAYRTLMSDSETIVKALRGLGYDVDKVTVLQPASQSSTQAQGEGDSANRAQFRQGNEQMNSGGSGNNGTGNRPGGSGHSAAQANSNGASMVDPDRTDGVYI